MLRALSIQHFAIIEQAELELATGFGVITGETGAGKSILVDALALISGARTQAGMVAHGQEKAELSAQFELFASDPAHQWLDDNDMAEADGSILIRRTIQASGGSRAWINGKPASASQLKELSSFLIEIHGQHAHQNISKADHQRMLLDTQCPSDHVAKTADAFDRWQQTKRDLDAFEAAIGDESQLELLRFQVKELQDLALAAGEFETLGATQERLQRRDEMKHAIQTAHDLLDQDEGPTVRSLLRKASHAISPLGALDPKLSSVAALIDESLIQIAEAVSELEHLGSMPEEDPEQLTLINERLATAMDLARKHRIKPEQLSAHTQSLIERLDAIEDQDAKRQQLQLALDQTRSKWQAAALALSTARKAAAKTLADATTKALHALGMNHADLAIEVRSDPDRLPHPTGMDEVRILFSANPGQPAQALSKVASGGELSRIALALMLAIGDRSGPMTRIFDEVDAGIGGETAHAVGEFLRQVGHAQKQGAQALCVTHLAQVAARADQHFRVIKSHEAGTSVSIEPLDDSKREAEIARMMGNSKSPTTLAHAKELLESCHPKA